MTDIYVNTTLSGICKSAIEMDNREHAEENVYETLEVVGTSRYKNNVSQRKAEPEEKMEEKSSSSHRIRPAISEISRKISLIQCIVVILVSLTVSSITGVVVYKLTKDGMKEIQLEIKSELSSTSSPALSNLSESFQDQIALLKKEMRQNVTILEQQMKDNVTVLEQHMKDNVTVLEHHMKDNDIALVKQTENNINNLKGNLSTNVTILYKKLDGVESEQSQLANRFDDRSTSIAAFTATYPAYYGRSYSSNYYTLNFSRTIYNLGGNFNSSTGMFTCTKPGTYYFSVFLVKKRSSNRINQVYCYLYKNYSNIIRTKVNPTDDDTDKGNAQAANSAVIHLNTGDVVYLRSCGSASSMEYWSSFSGFLLYPDA